MLLVTGAKGHRWSDKQIATRRSLLLLKGSYVRPHNTRRREFSCV